MYEVTVEAGFSSGHYLRNYRGKCENPHGHNYKVFVTLVGEELDEAGVAAGFQAAEAGDAAGGGVSGPPDDQRAEAVRRGESFGGEPCAKYFFDNTATQLDEMTHGRVKVKDCTLYETDTSFARYYE